MFPKAPAGEFGIPAHAAWHQNVHVGTSQPSHVPPLSFAKALSIGDSQSILQKWHFFLLAAPLFLTADFAFVGDMTNKGEARLEVDVLPEEALTLCKL